MVSYSAVTPARRKSTHPSQEDTNTVQSGDTRSTVDTVPATQTLASPALLAPGATSPVTPASRQGLDNPSRLAPLRHEAAVKAQLHALQDAPTVGGTTVEDDASGNRTLTIGDMGPAVDQVQRALGLPEPQRTGIYDTDTFDAVAAFQAEHQLNPGPKSGQTGATTLRYLRLEGPGSVTLEDVEAGNGVMQEGDVGRPVADLQRMLGLPVSGISGFFDADTRRAVEAFQAQQDLAVSGTVDASALGKLRSNRIHVDVPFYSQYDGRHVERAGDTACMRACRAMGMRFGAQGNGGSIQVATGENSNGTVNVNATRAREGREYIDSELRAGRPVIVGVSHKSPSPHNEGITDHFVIITGRGTEADGRTWYSFHDPAVGLGRDSVGSDANPENRFYLEESTGKLIHQGAMETGYVVDRHFEVSQVRRN